MVPGGTGDGPGGQCAAGYDSKPGGSCHSGWDVVPGDDMNRRWPRGNPARVARMGIPRFTCGWRESAPSMRPVRAASHRPPPATVRSSIVPADGIATNPLGPTKFLPGFPMESGQTEFLHCAGPELSFPPPAPATPARGRRCDLTAAWPGEGRWAIRKAGAGGHGGRGRRRRGARRVCRWRG